MRGLQFATMLAPRVLPFYEAVTAAVGRALGIETSLVVEDDYDACRNDVHDICFVCSLPYITFEREGHDVATLLAAPVLSGDRYGGRPIYFSDVIVARDSSARSFEDLRGASWAYNEPLSQSGYGITRYHLLTLGETDGFFGSVVESGFHNLSIEMVRTGEVDASAIDSQVLAIARRDDPTLGSEIRVIDSLGPSTIQPVAATRRMEPAMHEELTEILTTLHLDPELRPAFEHATVDRFVRVEGDHYDDVRSMLTACEEAGFMELR